MIKHWSLFGVMLLAGLGVWFMGSAMKQQKLDGIHNAIVRDGFTDIRMTGEKPGNGRYPVYGFEATAKNGDRVSGYVADEQGGIVKVQSRKPASQPK